MKWSLTVILLRVITIRIIIIFYRMSFFVSFPLFFCKVYEDGRKEREVGRERIS